MPREFTKDPDAVLSYKFDWKAKTNGSGPSDWLASGVTIASQTITADSGITVDSSSITDTSTSVTVTLLGGTAGNSYKVACKITTSDGQTDERTITIKVEER